MIAFRFAQKEDLKLIQQIAERTWWPTYESFLPKDQISAMLNEFYTEDALSAQIEHGHQFILATEEDVPFGFVSFSATESPSITKIHKLYIDPKGQGKGIGNKLINKVAQIAKAEGSSILELFVNRSNPALVFYEKIGFRVIKSIDIPYHQYILDDYVMHKTL